MSSRLELSAYQQDALAELCTVMSSVKHHIDAAGTYPPEEMTQRFSDAAERFDRINWGDLYDKLHRTGANYR